MSAVGAVLEWGVFDIEKMSDFFSKVFNYARTTKQSVCWDGTDRCVIFEEGGLRFTLIKGSGTKVMGSEITPKSRFTFFADPDDFDKMYDYIISLGAAPSDAVFHDPDREYDDPNINLSGLRKCCLDDPEGNCIIQIMERESGTEAPR